jgi:hypothetical protein
LGGFMITHVHPHAPTSTHKHPQAPTSTCTHKHVFWGGAWGPPASTRLPPPRRRALRASHWACASRYDLGGAWASGGCSWGCLSGCRPQGRKHPPRDRVADRAPLHIKFRISCDVSGMRRFRHATWGPAPNIPIAHSLAITAPSRRWLPSFRCCCSPAPQS